MSTLAVDGAPQSGSGTIVRYAVALPALLGQAVRVFNTASRIGTRGNLIALPSIVLSPNVSVRRSLQKAFLRGPLAARLLVIGIAYAVPAYAQAIASGRPDFRGTWTFDIYLSDNPEQVARALRIDTGQGGQEAFVGGGIDRGRPGGIGRGGGGRGDFDSPGRGRVETVEQLRPEDRKKLAELTDAVQFASPTLTIAQTDSTITIAGIRSGNQTLTTNGEVEKQTLDAGAVDRVARWEGPTLVVAYEVGHAGTLTYTYLVVPTTKQLMIRVNFERVRGQPGPFDIKLVYNRAGQP